MGVRHWSSRRQTFRALLEGDRCVCPASTYDTLSARIAETLGFELGMLGGSVACVAVLGAPDVSVLTLTELAEQTRRISRAVNLPLMVDADHGYGNSLNVMRTVEELELAGAAGLSLEDTVMPRQHGSVEAPQFTSLEEGVAKLLAALRARRDPDLIIAGRTDTAKSLGAEEAARRVKAYAETGIDAVFLVGVQSIADLARIMEGVELPLILADTRPDVADVDKLEALGARVWLKGHQPIAASTKAIYETMKHLRDGGSPVDLCAVQSADLMNKVSRKDCYEEWANEFL